MGKFMSLVKDDFLGDNRGQLLTLDLLVSLIPVVLVLGISANAMTGVVNQMQDYSSSYDYQRMGNDIADVLIRTRGVPDSWTAASVRTLGLVSYTGSSCTVGADQVISHLLDTSKINIINDSISSASIRDALYNLSSGNNIRITITNISDSSNPSTLLDVAGYNSGGVWMTTRDSAAIDSEIGNASSTYYSERIVGVLPESAKQVLTSKCNFTAAGDIEGAPAVGDLDGDGDNEVVFADSAGNVYALNSTCSQIWSFATDDTINEPASPAIANLDFDDALEVLISDNNGTIYAIDSDGTSIWNRTEGTASRVTPAIGNVDVGDLEAEIAIVSEAGSNYGVLINAEDNSEVWRYNLSCRSYASPTIADVDGDGSLDVIFAPSTCPGNIPNVVAFDQSGAMIWNFTDFNGAPYEYIYASPSVYDIDGDGTVEIVVMDCADGCSDGYALYIINGSDGTLIDSEITPYFGDSSPALADLNDDGELEIVVGTRVGSGNNKTYALFSDGTQMWSCYSK
jgi:hypothetical protein